MTDILERINDLNRKKQELTKESEMLKKEFSSYISNKDISLAQRWKTFCQAPDELSNHEVYGRGKKISTKEMFYHVFTNSDLEYNNEDYSEKEIALYKEAMEEVLSKNCASFCFDW